MSRGLDRPLAWALSALSAACAGVAAALLVLAAPLGTFLPADLQMVAPDAPEPVVARTPPRFSAPGSKPTAGARGLAPEDRRALVAFIRADGSSHIAAGALGTTSAQLRTRLLRIGRDLESDLETGDRPLSKAAP